MKKFLAICIALVAMVASAHTVETRLFDNTYVTLKGGATALMHPGCNGYANWGHTIEAATGLEFGKWITPRFGVSLDGTNGWTNGSKVGVFQDKYTVNYLTVAALAKYRFMPFNKFNIALAAGPQWIHGFKKEAEDANDLGAKMKIEFNYNFNNHFALQVAPELNYNMRHVAWIPTKTQNQPYFDSRRAWYGLMVGVTYKIGNEFQECTYRYTQADIDRLNAEINDLRNRKPEVVTEIQKVEVIKEVPVGQQTVYVVAFDYGKAELDQAGRDVLNSIPEDVIVDVQGEASYPGSANYNQALSERRANVVAGYLANRGVHVGNCNGIGATGHQIVKVIVK